MSVRIAFRGHERRDEHSLLLIFAVNDGHGEQTASVWVNPRTGSASFPHHLSDTGESWGPAVDAALLDRARQMVAMFAAAEAWAEMRSTVSTMRWAA